MKSYVRRRESRLLVEGVDVKQLTDKIGTPLYLLSKNQLIDQFRKFRDAFNKEYSNVAVAYSYKTNYLPSVCAILKKEGAWAEVVSLFELSIAEMVNLNPEHIVFNGPCKTKDELRTAIKMGVRVINVDSFSELGKICSIVRNDGVSANVGFRLSSLTRNPLKNKFGSTAEQIIDECQVISKEKRIKFVGLHTHVGTQIGGTAQYETSIDSMVELATSIYKRFGLKTEIIDIGGGFAVKEVVPYSQTDWSPPSFEDYSKTICSRLKCTFADNLKELPLLILEPGRAIVYSAMLLITKVVVVKQVAGVTWVLTDAGFNLIPDAEFNKQRVVPVVLRKGKTQKVNIAGPLCAYEDVIRYDLNMAPIQEGDLLAILDTGAYNVSLSWQFIKTRAPVCLIDKGEWEIIRRREKSEDILRLDTLPSS